MDENFKIKDLGLPEGQVVRFHLDGLTHINSTGIREWIKWIKAYKSVTWSFWECPPQFINQINMIDGFLPQGSTIESFYIPYYSDQTDEEKLMLIIRREFEKAQNTVKAPRDSQGHEMFADIIEDRYLQFLKTY